MAVELFMGYKSYYTTGMQQQQHSPVEEAASAGLQSVEKLLQLLSHSQQQPQQVDESELDCRSVADVAVNKFKKVISLLGRTRTGHARFRRAPPAARLDDENNAFETKEQVVSTSQIYIPTTPVPRLPPLPPNHQPYKHQPNNLRRQDSSTTISFSSSTTPNNSFISSETANGQIVGSLKRNCSSSDVTSGSGKRRKSLVKRVVKVPAINLKTGDIPPDAYSWRKYGQKPIKGSPHPRSYYKCCNLKDCPARKHVERSLEDPTMLIVTYEGEHNHAKPLTEAEARILESS